MAIKLDADRDPMVPELGQLRRRKREAAHTWTLEIELADDDARRDHVFRPGQFSMLYVFGVGEIPVSLSGDPRAAQRLVYTIRDVGPVSHALTQLKPGDGLGVRGPFGQGWPLEVAGDKDVVIVAGGLGLAPLRPLLYQLMAKRARYGKVALLYGARSPSEILFGKEFSTWATRHNIEVRVTVDHATDDWRGDVGVVTTLIGRASFDPDDTVAMICGPEVMMRFSVNTLRDAGVADDAIYVSMERNMKCAIGHCGHCQFGPSFICKDGPVLCYDRIRSLLAQREI